MTPPDPNALIQTPIPGEKLLRFRGDLVRFSLRVQNGAKGSAWLRTNIGWAGIGRREIIGAVERDEAQLGLDWFDLSMVRTDADRFEIRVPLSQVGHFGAKCYFQPDKGEAPLWPPGQNVTVNVEPADTCCGNTIYNAFVRQFGPDKARPRELSEAQKETVRQLDERGFAVIPPSGTFRDLISELDFIVHTLGCRYLQLLPINPTPTTYGRMGRFGSPYAALSFTAVDPALARFDPKATPLDQFIELLDAVHSRGAKILLDLAVNHTGWAADLHETHAEWLKRDPQGRIENPGAWGVTWEDLTELDYRHRELWRYMADIFLTWCRRGVDGFRCDAGYMVPLPAWKYIIAKVRQQYPDTLFFLEGLGGKRSVTRDLLDSGNFNWAYSELFQTFDRGAVEHYLPQALETARGEGLMIHFCETHDNNRLAATSRDFSRMRTALCALASFCGGFAFANGVEWFAEQKIDVHGSPSLNWGAKTNQVAEIRRLTRLLHHHPAFHDRADIEMIQEGGDNCLVFFRHHRPTERRLLIVVNLDPDRPAEARWDSTRAKIDGSSMADLLTEQTVHPTKDGTQHRLALSPGQVLCLSAGSEDLQEIQDAKNANGLDPERLRIQRLRAKALEVLIQDRGIGHVEETTLAEAVRRLAADPSAYCRGDGSNGAEPRTVFWRWPEDLRREVMVPPGHFLLVTAPAPFRIRLMEYHRCVAAEDSLKSDDGRFFALVEPGNPVERSRARTLAISVFEAEAPRHGSARLHYLSAFEAETVKTVFNRSDLLGTERLLLGTNGIGGMLRASLSWAKLNSRYDALLAANLHPEAPDDRRILLTRCRAWSVFQGTSQPFGDDCLDMFTTDGASRGIWRFRLPTGQGQHTIICLGIEMLQAKNAVRMVFFRERAGQDPRLLPDDKPVSIIVRPDIEDRSFHEVTKAYLGPEHRFAPAVANKKNGFDFQPDPARALSLRAEKAAFVREPEWYYMVHRPLEAERGLDPDSDLFSPGYLTGRLVGGGHLEITAAAAGRPEPEPFDPSSLLSWMAEAFEKNASPVPSAVWKQALGHYVVRRESLNTVIAGYPWFLDWGRDTLIFVRGLIAAGSLDTASRILKQFAAFEDRGTLPNMIRGEDAGNRDTSDAPLWFFIACADFCAAEGSLDFLETGIGPRTMGKLLKDMAGAMIDGTPNGIRMDPASGLLFSPAHFSWMDTNHPAGTPRQGYPVEIQALWWAALNFLAGCAAATEGSWAELADRVRTSMAALYTRRAVEIGLSDCLHATPGTPADNATADDALRPNQLFALTLGAVSDSTLGRQILEACQALVVPGAIRSLADRSVEHPLSILHHGQALIDPHRPYQGRYSGDEDTRRKPAYHNGTAWTWVFPSFCEAWAAVFPKNGRKTALAYLGSGARLLEAGCLGHMPEILDGDTPHHCRGCDAQAWGASEFFRVWKKLSSA